jgi:hypothetical protein
VLPGLEPDKKLVWTYFEAMVSEKMPKSLLVVGSGAIDTVGGVPHLIAIEVNREGAHLILKPWKWPDVTRKDGKNGRKFLQAILTGVN